MYTFYWYPKCSTCKKAKAWLDQHNVSYQAIDMIQAPPAADTLDQWISGSDLPLRRFFNTSGMKYRELGLKDKIPEMTQAEACQLLASDGMLIKRPLLIKDDQVAVVGFKEDEYEQL